MKYSNKDKSLDDLLKELNDSIEWNKQRQQKVKNNFYTNIRQHSSRKKRKTGHRLKLLNPVISTLLLILIATILISVISTPQRDFTSSIDNKFNKQENSIIIREEQNEQIRKIRELGFVLAIPKYALKPNVELENIIHRNNEDNNYVYTQFSSNDNELFSIHQEAIHNKRQAERTIKNHTEQLKIQGLTVYFRESEVQNKIFLMTDKYSLEISSHYLSKEELVKILESVQLEKLVE